MILHIRHYGFNFDHTLIIMELQERKPPPNIYLEQVSKFDIVTRSQLYFVSLEVKITFKVVNSYQWVITTFSNQTDLRLRECHNKIT